MIYLGLQFLGEMEHISLVNKLFRFCELDQVNNWKDLSAFLNHFRARKQLEPKCLIDWVVYELDKQGGCHGFQQMKTLISACN